MARKSLNLMPVTMLVLTILIASSMTEGVNTLCISSPINIPNGTWYYMGVVWANFWFSQIQVTEQFRMYGGMLEENVLMAFQMYQPQQFLYCGPGQLDGESTTVGINNHYDTLTAWDWRNLYNAGGRSKTPPQYFTPAPFSVITLCASDAGDNFGGVYDLIDVFRDWHYSWIVVGPTHSIRASDSFRLAYNYGLQYQKFGYVWDSWHYATLHTQDRINFRLSDNNYFAGTGGYPSGQTSYLRIMNEHSSEGLLLQKDQSTTLIYDADGFPGRLSDGAYVVFHGTIDDNPLDTDTGTIEMDFYKNLGDGFGWFWFADETYGIQNRNCLLDGNPGHKALGGSDICTRYLGSNHFDYDDDFQIKVVLKFTSNQAQKIRIDRFEFMEIV